MRLSLYLSKSGCCSRRKADILIDEGKVKVNDQVIRKPYFQVSGADKVELSGSLVSLQAHSYLIFHKPKGVTTTLSDPHAQKVIASFFPPDLLGIYPVGRLDRDSSGLIILTNDGDFCHRLTHPKFEIEKEYLATISGFLRQQDFPQAKTGITVDGELLRVKNIAVLNRGTTTTLVKIIITEGKKRHLRRLFKAMGFEIIDLKRIRIAGLTMKNLEPGQYQKIDKKTLEQMMFPKSHVKQQPAKQRTGPTVKHSKR